MWAESDVCLADMCLCARALIGRFTLLFITGGEGRWVIAYAIGKSERHQLMTPGRLLKNVGDATLSASRADQAGLAVMVRRKSNSVPR